MNQTDQFNVKCGDQTPDFDLESLESQFTRVNCHWTAEGKLYIEFN